MMTNIYFLIMSLSFLPTMQNVADKICTENHNIHFMFNSPPRKSFRPVYVIMWENTV